MALKDEFNNLSLFKCLLIGGGIMAGYYFFVFDKGEKQVAEMNTIQEDVNKKKVLLNQVQQAIADKVAFQRESEALEIEMKQLMVYMPVHLDMNEMQRDLTLRLQETNNKVQSLKNAEVTSRFPGYTEHGLDLQSVGGFHEIMAFLSSITKLNRIVDFKTMDFETLTTTEDGTLIQFKTLISVFKKDAVDPNAPPSEPKK
jgi:Tfp pilus assembly protein PilO